MYFYVLAAMLLFPLNLIAQEVDGIKSFAPEDSWRREEKSTKEINNDVVLPEISDYMGHAAMQNILNAEQIFCYKITKRPKNYDGYTLNGMAVTGFCGILNSNLQNRIVKEFFKSPNNVLLDTVDNCTMQPKAMLRFVRGVDSTDILISAPCYSYALFYAGKAKVYNAKPMSSFLNSLIKAFDKKETSFISPTLLGQALPIGIIKTEEDKQMLQEKESKTLKKWDSNIAKEKEKPAFGWNSLSF